MVATKHKVYLTKEIDFHTGHLLDGHEGNCKNVHGHNYHLKATFEGSIQEGLSSLKGNMAVDFYHIMDILSEEIMVAYDHSFIVPGHRDSGGFTDKVNRIIDEMGTKKTIVANFGCSTAEAMSVDIFNRIKEGIKSRDLRGILKLTEVKLYETARAAVTYRGEHSL